MDVGRFPQVHHTSCPLSEVRSFGFFGREERSIFQIVDSRFRHCLLKMKTYNKCVPKMKDEALPPVLIYV